MCVCKACMHTHFFPKCVWKLFYSVILPAKARGPHFFQRVYAKQLCIHRCILTCFSGESVYQNRRPSAAETLHYLFALFIWTWMGKWRMNWFWYKVALNPAKNAKLYNNTTIQASTNRYNNKPFECLKWRGRFLKWDNTMVIFYFVEKWNYDIRSNSTETVDCVWDFSPMHFRCRFGIEANIVTLTKSTEARMPVSRN